MDMEALMAQASQIQAKVTAAQEKLGQMRVKGLSDDGACIVEMTGKYDLVQMTLRDDVLSQGAAAVSEIVSAAYRDAKAKADTLIDRIMGEATSGMPMPE